ncbi:N-acetylglucosamine-6-phosphate deacetylase [Pseudohalioglobus lutimaris]|uniref:N-acetylglucosamine-6-phosphate deacetylase n=1 Tax=Pseudohalioglobus lutimaris TaxID=1737061 RepID=A0A2N5WXK7_9GAMM|nr:N-acetylglucosamine-6-phosphate deacetylase [Pseudohalioglobus lutimaris]PLW66955.1 N-acetylglucosamine-6-phosphate deacetylase [Pseudohalioglobus lutimaris]
MPGHSPPTALKARQVFDGEYWQWDHAVLLRGEYIEDICPADEVPQGVPVNNLGDVILAPGLIDIQVNGGGGQLFNNQADAQAVSQIAAAHRRFGTTGLMPTIISDTPAVHRAAAKAISEARHSGEKGILGLHIEGPFFEPGRRGTHKAEMIRPLEDADLAWLCTLQDFPVMLTIAPEHVTSDQLRALARAGLLLCAGHTNANYADIRRAIDCGLRGFTHLFNAMSPLTAREPGTVGAALDDSNTWAGIIADGHHVHPTTISLAKRCKSPEKLLLVSDAMATVGAADDSFELYGERIQTKDGRLVNAEGKLAGSAIALIDAVRIAHQLSGIELGECLRMASLYPAAFLKLEGELGRLQRGYRADLLCFDAGYRVTDTWVAGQHATHVHPACA